MSKQKKSARRKQNKSYGDVTINDFANSTVIKSREKKSSSNVTTAIKQLEIDKPWDEKDFDEDFDFVEEENADGTITYVLKTVKVKNQTLKETDDRPGNDYPLDVWFLISDFIRPEDVGTFSAICKTSNAVCNTAKFWFSLYRRYYTNIPKLPERLQPECLQRLYGVRTSVIRALYYMYPLFRMKLFKIEEHPAVLLKRQCDLMWHSKNKTQWIFYFKLKNNCFVSKHREKTTKPDIIEMLEDVSANSEKNCRILQITCLNFIHVPPVVLGMFLISAGVTLSQGFRHNRVQLNFSSGAMSCQKKLMDSNSVSILLDPVISVKILDWWHPLYPHGNSMDLLLHQE